MKQRSGFLTRSTSLRDGEMNPETEAKVVDENERGGKQSKSLWFGVLLYNESFLPMHLYVFSVPKRRLLPRFFF